MTGKHFFQPLVFLVCLLTLLLACGCVSEFKKIRSWEHFPWNKTVETSDRQGKQSEASVEKEGDQQKFLVHRIRWKGETLSIIAKWYMGRIDDWKILAKINPELAYQNLHKGETVRIPVEKAKTSVSMPKDFLDAFAGKTETPEKRKPAEEADKPAKVRKEQKAEEDPPAETDDKQPYEEEKGDKKKPGRTAGNGPSDDTVDQEPDLFGPKELDTE